MLPLLDLELLRARAEDLTAEAVAYRRHRIEPVGRNRGRVAGKTARPDGGTPRGATAPAATCRPCPGKA